MYVDRGSPLPDAVVEDIRDAILRLNIAPGPGGSRIVPVEIPEIVGLAGATLVAALWPSSQIVAHRDPPIAGTRLHLPLQTNDSCWVFHEGVWQQLALGHVYRMDPTGVHGAVNWGTEIRYHLIVDVP